jgi:hypothetical protein
MRDHWNYPTVDAGPTGTACQRRLVLSRVNHAAAPEFRPENNFFRRGDAIAPEEGDYGQIPRSMAVRATRSIAST